MLADLKRENAQLKRQVGRLQKENAYLKATRSEAEESAQEQEPAMPAIERCPCGGAVSSFTTPGGKVVKACKACKSRLL